MRVHTSLRRLGLVAVTAGLTLQLTPATVAASAAVDSGGALEVRVAVPPGDKPSDADLTRLAAHARPGDVVDRWIEVVNPSRLRQHVTVYPAGATIRNDTFSYAEGRTGNELSRWTRVPSSTFRLEPRAKKPVRIRLTVPASAAPGERYAVIWAQIAAAAPKSPKRAGKAPPARRTGLRVYLNVGTGAEPQPAFEIVGMRAEQTARGVPVVVAQVRNTGPRALDPHGTLRLSTASSPAALGPFTALGGVTIAPQSSGSMTVPLYGRLPAGPWNAELAVADGAVLRESKATLSLPEPRPSSLVVTKDDGPSMILILAATGALLGVLVLLGLRLRRRGRRPVGAHRARRTGPGAPRIAPPEQGLH
ncbi:hypothetical protein [Plantactinospora endophytica]|uniref:Peptidase n=1 Tax=Plantactinospora endophytica TaxID=673535 RepID=A0ABQ4E1E5_9ACTN|nr:hypothetical protein [Plantactinospora endophytica]GIG88496.1 hypothetical protein Pen02_34320 [Plantactinospora endophytica]